MLNAMVPGQEYTSDNSRGLLDEEELHQDCDEICQTCRDAWRQREKKQEAKHYATVMSAQQKELWSGILFHPDDPLCQQIIEDLK